MYLYGVRPLSVLSLRAGVMGSDEVVKVRSPLIVIVAMEALDVQRENGPPDRFLIRFTSESLESRIKSRQLADE